MQNYLWTEDLPCQAEGVRVGCREGLPWAWSHLVCRCTWRSAHWSGLENSIFTYRLDGCLISETCGHSILHPHGSPPSPPPAPTTRAHLPHSLSSQPPLTTQVQLNQTFDLRYL